MSKSLARRLYEATAGRLGWKDKDGDPIATWAESTVKKEWRVLAEVVKELLRQKHGKGAKP